MGVRRRPWGAAERGPRRCGREWCWLRSGPLSVCAYSVGRCTRSSHEKPNWWLGHVKSSHWTETAATHSAQWRNRPLAARAAEARSLGRHMRDLLVLTAMLQGSCGIHGNLLLGKCDKYYHWKIIFDGSDPCCKHVLYSLYHVAGPKVSSCKDTMK
uniref:chemokine-like protein TAFA-5 isoform X1 n=1 Tax=Myxine glutinosa TaxID=7769 RepID=UPI00358E8C4D